MRMASASALIMAPLSHRAIFECDEFFKFRIWYKMCEVCVLVVTVTNASALRLASASALIMAPLDSRRPGTGVLLLLGSSVTLCYFWMWRVFLNFSEGSLLWYVLFTCARWLWISSHWRKRLPALLGVFLVPLFFTLWIRASLSIKRKRRLARHGSISKTIFLSLTFF